MADLLEQYRDVAPRGTVDFLRRLGERVAGRTMLHVNSTRTGGGVAEILQRLLPLLQEVGITAANQYNEQVREVHQDELQTND